MREPDRFHVALNVQDLARSVRFYRGVLGLEPDKQHPGYARFLLDAPLLVLSLNEVPRVKAGNRVAHLGIRLGSASALTEVRARVVAAGHPVRDQRQTLCCHSIQDKFWVLDPDGNEWEFYEVTDDHPTRAKPASEAESAEDCCS
ncbi:MAG: glyoxalase/bleomycin resistance/dioxygenase family protein [Planctomycetes bacterium]|nr:glyoxalase/bleomycin resistance/dioxygenase family protein [Planctomycetota bacterium]